VRRQDAALTDAQPDALKDLAAISVSLSLASKVDEGKSTRFKDDYD